MAKKKPTTWLEVAVLNGGIRKAVKGLTWAYSWGVAREDLGHEPTVEEVAEWWKQPIRSAYREQAAFRSCFPTLDTPAPIADNPQVRAAAREAIDLFDQSSSKLDSIRAASADRAVLNIGLLTPPASFLT
jgi:hypothetical protein